MKTFNSCWKNFWILSTLSVSALSVVLSASSSIAAEGRGGMDGGGGSYVVIDGETFVADPYFAGRPASLLKKISPASYTDLPKEVRDYVDQILEFMVALRIDRDKVYLFGEQILKSGKYFLVPKEREQNVPCERYLPVLNRHVDAHFQFGCTFGQDTYLFVDKWKNGQDKLNNVSIAEQAFAILHERLWAANPSADQADIATFNGWLERFERRHVRQLLGTDRRPLTEDEVKGVSAFFKAAGKLGFTSDNVDNRISIVSGGAFVFGDCRQALRIENSFLSLGTMISNCGRAAPRLTNSVILDSQINFFGQDAEIRDGRVVSSMLGPVKLSKSEIIQSKVNENGVETYTRPIDIVESRIESSVIGYHSKLDGEKWTISNSQIKDSSVAGTFLKSTLNKSTVSGYVENSKFKNSWTTGRISYSDVVDSSIGCSNTESVAELNGTAASRIRVTKSDVGAYKSAIQAGASIGRLTRNDGFCYAALNVGANVSISQLKISNDRDSTTYWFELAIENGTQVENGSITFDSSKPCAFLNTGNKSYQHFYLGQPGQASRIDLKGRLRVLTGSFPGCSARL